MRLHLIPIFECSLLAADDDNLPHHKFHYGDDGGSAASAAAAAATGEHLPPVVYSLGMEPRNSCVVCNAALLHLSSGRKAQYLTDLRTSLLILPCMTTGMLVSKCSLSFSAGLTVDLKHIMHCSVALLKQTPRVPHILHKPSMVRCNHFLLTMQVDFHGHADNLRASASAAPPG